MTAARNKRLAVERWNHRFAPAVKPAKVEAQPESAAISERRIQAILKLVREYGDSRLRVTLQSGSGAAWAVWAEIERSLRLPGAAAPEAPSMPALPAAAPVAPCEQCEWRHQPACRQFGCLRAPSGSSDRDIRGNLREAAPTAAPVDALPPLPKLASSIWERAYSVNQMMDFGRAAIAASRKADTP